MRDRYSVQWHLQPGIAQTSTADQYRWAQHGNAEAGQGRTRLAKAGQGRTEEGRAGQGMVWQGRAGEGRAV